MVNTNLQRRWENVSLASNLPITLTDGPVLGQYWPMHISRNLILCLERGRESGLSLGNNDIMRSSGHLTRSSQEVWVISKI